jgi:Tfp pilus assembly protein PilZ
VPESKRERRGHFRGKARPGRRVEVRYRTLSHGQLSDEQRAYTKNIGVGGAFIITPDPPPPGTLLHIAISVPAASRVLEVRGDVRWIVDGAHEEDPREHGMGVKFGGLDVDQLMALNEYFASLTSTMDHDEA